MFDGSGTCAHVSPPSPVTTMEYAPTATQLLADEQAIPFSGPTTGGTELITHDVPPAELTTTAPDPPGVSPTAMHACVVGQSTADSAPTPDGTV